MQRFRFLAYILIATLLLPLFPVPTAEAAPGEPAVVSLTPNHGATAAVTNTSLALTFDEPILRGTGVIQLFKNSSTSPVQEFNVTSSSEVQLDNQSRSIVMTPSAALEPGESYYVIVPRDAVRNYAGDSFAGIGPGQWSFTAERLAPVAENFVPVHGFEYLDPASPGNLSFDFNRDKMVKGTGYIQIKRVTDNVTARSVDVRSSEVTLTQVGRNWRVSFPLRGLDFGTPYYVLIDYGALVDPDNGPYAGIQGTGVWTFKTKPALDTTKPKITTYVPENNGTLTILDSPVLSLTFDKPVFANLNRSLAITTAAGALVCTIPASSTVGSAGSAQVSISFPGTCPNLINNADYIVQIGPDVYRDASGNYLDSVSWRFKALKDTTPPAVTAYSPTVSSTTVSTSIKEFSLTFNEPLGTLGSGAVAKIFPQNAPNSTRDLTMRIDQANNRRVIFTLTGTTNLNSSTQYSITVPTNVIQDPSGNFFGGITNPHQWTFRTGTSSVPTISSSTINGATITLTFSENLDATKTPNASNFYAVVNDVQRGVTGVSISGREVRLTLQSSVLVGQTVRLSYFPDSAANRRLQNTSGIEVAAFNNRTITNSTASTLPQPENGFFNGNTVTLTFNKSLAEVAPGFQAQIYGQFTVKQNGVAIGVKSGFLGGNVLTLQLSSSSTSPHPVSVSYTPGAYPLRDPSGSMVPAFSDFYVRNSFDNEPPQLVSASLNNTKIVLTFNEGLNPTNVPPESSFSIVATGATTPPTVTKVAVANNTIELTLSNSVASNVPVLLYYYPGNPPITDLSGNASPAIVGFNFTSGSGDVAVMASSTITATQLTLNYSAPLKPNPAPHPSQYTVKYDGVTIPVLGVSVSGSQVNLNMNAPANAGQTVTLSYSTSGNPLRDALDRPVAALNNITVGAQTGTGGTGGTIANLPDYLEGDGSGGVQFVTAKASSTSLGSTPTGQTMARYSLDGTKFIGAYDAIRSNTGVTVPRITFKVPTTETGAIVAVPISAIMDASARASNTSFRVEYGEYQFELPLVAVNYNKEIYLAGGNTTSSYFQIIIEKSPNAPVLSTLNIHGAQSIATPADFSAGILTGNNYRAVEGYEQYVSGSFLLPAVTGSQDNVAVIRLDPQSSQPTYVPTSFETVGGALKANFKRKANGVYTIVSRSASFTDMTTHWARNEVHLLASKFIVTGDTNRTFAPGKNITRAEFAEFIARGIGLDGDRTAAGRFADVSATSASAAFIGAASQAGIVQGGSDGRFRPTAAITREEMATMLVRAMNYVGVQTNPSSTALNGFKDRAKVSSWAKSGMEMCVTAGFIQGTNTQTVNPQHNATRAEAALMIKRFLDYVEFL